MASRNSNCGLRHPEGTRDCGLKGGRFQSEIRNPKSEIGHLGFTLVELLVVITIIGILAALITAAAVGAIKKGRQTEIKAELNQIDGGFSEFRNKTTAFPPNCQVDGTGGSNPISEPRVLSDVKRFMKLAFPRHQEPDWVIARLAGHEINPTSPSATPTIPGLGKQLAGGITAGEAVVFWLGGFSQDPKYPISGEGGPSYAVVNQTASINIPAADRHKADPIESRKWVYPFKVERLVPRTSEGYFDETKKRYFEYPVTVNGVAQTRRINFWQYTPRKSEQPYMYFDTSRYPPPATASADMTDPPAATALTGLGPSTSEPFYVFPFKKRNEAAGTSNALQYINPDKFQIIHCGINDRWDHEAFKNNISSQYGNASNFLLFPDGPFVGDMADAIVNFTTETRIEDAQK